MLTKPELNRFDLEKITYQIAVILAIFFVCLFIASMYHRYVTLDDAWFAEQAYWFAHDGYVHSNLFEGFSVFANEILVYHKLHIWQGAMVYKLFGWNAYYFQAIAIPYLLLFLALFYYLLKQIAPVQNTKKIFVFFIFLFFCNHVAFFEGFEYRPEIPMMSIGFLSYLFLRQAKLVNSIRFAFLSGLMAGITALLHINGLIFVAAGGLMFLLDRQYKLAFFFGLAAIIGFAPYFYQLTSIDKLHHYFYDLTHDPAVHNNDRSISGMLYKLLSEYQRFTHHIYEFSYLMLFLVVLISGWKRLTANPEYKNLLFYILFLTIFMALITTGSKTQYLLYSMPYVLLLVSSNFTSVLNHKSSTIIFLLFLSIYTLTNLDKNYGVFVDHKYESPKLYADIMKKYQIHPGMQIFAPAQFIFNEIGTVKIQAFTSYLIKYRDDWSKVTMDNVLNDVHKRNKEFAILRKLMLTRMKLKDDPEKGVVYSGYKYLGKESDLFIFKRVHEN